MFARERIDYFNLAFLDVHEPVRLFAGLDHDRALVIRHDFTRCPQCLHMRGGKWCSNHLAQVLAYGFHGAPQGYIHMNGTRFREIWNPPIFGALALGAPHPVITTQIAKVNPAHTPVLPIFRGRGRRINIQIVQDSARALAAISWRISTRTCCRWTN
jgi:hypothetical protein